jgi:DNA-binding transcriptional ArsR family regulator
MSDVRRRDYELDEHLDADTPERLKALADPLRMQIIDLVLERAMSVTELAAVVGRPKGTVAYHVDVLVDAGLVHVVRTRKVRAVEERFYGRVARTYLLPDTPGEFPFLNEVLAEADLSAMTEPLPPEYQGPPGTQPGLVTYRHARVPLARAAEYARRLNELALEFVDEPREGDVEFGLYLALFPTTRFGSIREALTDE